MALRENPRIAQERSPNRHSERMAIDRHGYGRSNYTDGVRAAAWALHDCSAPHAGIKLRRLFDDTDRVDLDFGRPPQSRVDFPEEFHLGFFIDRLAGEILIVYLCNNFARSVRK